MKARPPAPRAGGRFCVCARVQSPCIQSPPLARGAYGGPEPPISRTSPAAQYLFDRNHAGGLTWGEKSVAWNSDDAEHQFNENGKTYHYIAIGTV